MKNSHFFVTIIITQKGQSEKYDLLRRLADIEYKGGRLMAKGFAKGLVTGVAGTVAAVAGAVYAFKKKVIEPEEQKAAFIEENRKKAARRRVSR
ncbi:hypothetical protein HMPREF0851_00776 [Streptococcus sp. M334]|nr:hypothetical protein HMPREF0851_00776 [Streptococcus sp. M334]